ncbi:MAG: hypothetical protein LUH15_06150, partial [Tannerellaceae bacterium]|nr:hypothetical protein [Tannerellaceae bacterium]
NATLIKSFIIKIYYKFIFYPFKRLLPIESLYESFKNKPRKIAEYQLQQFSQVIRDYNHITYYTNY